MVIRKTKCVDGKEESHIDWVKSLAVIGVFGAIILWSVQVSTSADQKATVALSKIDSLDKKTDKMDDKLDRLVNFQLQRGGK